MRRVDKLLIVLLLAGTIAVELALPVVAWWWVRDPFLGLLFEQTLVVSGIRNDDWGVSAPPNPTARLVAVNDRPVALGPDLNRLRRTMTEGDRATLTLEMRDGSPPRQIQTTARRFPLADWISFFWLPYAVGLVYLGIGVWVFRHRGDSRPGQSFVLFCAFLALSVGTLFDLSSSYLFARIWVTAIPFTAAALLHLAMVFPEEGAITRRYPWVRFLPYPCAAILALANQLRLFDVADPWAYIDTWRWSYIAVALAAFSFFALMLYTRARTISGIVRQQVRLILIGSLLAFLPIVVYLAFSGLGVDLPFQPVLYLPTLVIFPTFVAFAILRYKLLGMDLVISRGLAYTVLIASIAGAYFLVLSVLGQYLGIQVTNNNPLLLAFFVVILILVFNPLRRGFEGLIDQLLGRQRFDYRQALQTFSHELVSTPLDLPAVVERLLAQIEPVAHSAPVLVFLREPASSRYTLYRAIRFVNPGEREPGFGRDSGVVRWLEGYDHPIYLLEDQEQIPAPNLDGEDWQIANALGMVLYLPLKSKSQRSATQERLGGWVALGPRLSGEPYSPDDLNFMTALVDQAAIAIENARLLDDLEQQVVRLDVLRKISEAVDLREDPEDLLALVYEQTCRVLEVDNFYVALYNADRQEFRFAYYVEEKERRQPEQQAWPLGTGLTSQIVRDRRPIVTDNYLAECERRGIPHSGNPARAWLGVPLIASADGQVLGVLNVSSFKQGYHYTAEQVQLVSTITEQAAVALDRMRLYQETEARAAELITLSEVTRTINSTLDLSSVLDMIMTRVVELLDVEAGSLLLMDEESSDLVFQVVLGNPNSDQLIGRRYPIGAGIVGHAAQSGQTLIVNDVRADARWDHTVDEELGFTTHTLLCVPMISRGRVTGVIEVINRRDGNPFDEDEASLLTSFAAQAATAIENARLYTQTDQALARRVEELSTMQRIDRELNAALDFDHVMDMTLEWALRGTGAPVGVIALYDEEREGLLLLASRGYPLDFGRYRQEPWPLGEGIVGRVVHSGKPALVSDVAQDPDYEPAQPNTRSQLSVPIRREDRVIGVVNLESPALAAFNLEALAFLERLVDHAAIAIENARLHAETEKRLQEQVALREAGAVMSSDLNLEVVLGRIAEQMGQAVDATSAYICDLDLETSVSAVLAEYISPHASEKEKISDLGDIYTDTEPEFLEMMQSGEHDVSHIDDPELTEAERAHMEKYGAHTILYIPLQIRGRVIGFTELWESRWRRQFTPDEVALCQGIAQQAAMAIENARLYQESQRRADDMTLLYDISLTVSSHLALDEVLEAVYKRIKEVWDPPVFYIALYDEEDDALDFPIYVDRGTRLKPFRHLLAEKEGFSAWIVRNRRPILIRDWEKEVETSPIQGVAVGEVTRSWLGVPLLFGERRVGVLSVQDYEPNAFGQEHERFLSTIASEVAIALENARLYRQAEDYAQELAARAERLALVNRISMAVNATLDLDEMLQTATREMAKAFGVKQAGTVLFDYEAGYGKLFAEYHESPGSPPGEVRIPLTGNPSLERVITTRRPLAIADVHHDPLTESIREMLGRRNIESILIVPLMVKGTVTGTIGLDSVGRQRIFTSEEIDLAQTIANQVGLAVENIHLYQETQQRLSEVTLLFDTSAAVSETLDLDVVLRTTAEQITRALGTNGCAISLWDREEEALVTLLDYSSEPGWKPPESEVTVYALANYPASQKVLTSRQPRVVQINDPTAAPTEISWMTEQSITSLLMVPLVTRDEAVGLLELFQSDEPREFTPTEIRLCQTLANQAAAAMENARLYKGVKEADQAKSEFIDFVAHELKQPMTAMQGYAKMLIMGIGGELSDTQRQFVDVITSNVDRMGKLVNDLLEISRLEAGRTQLNLMPVNLREVVNETVTNTRTEVEARHHTLEVEVPQDLPLVVGDRDRLVQVLTNLVSNAYKYTPEGGQIRIVIDGRDRFEVPPTHLLVSVSDTGIGMSPKDIDSLQEKFFRADHDLVHDQPGTGLGVSITRNLVELHGGELVIESQENKGSTFSFTVPIVQTDKE